MNRRSDPDTHDRQPEQQGFKLAISRNDLVSQNSLRHTIKQIDQLAGVPAPHFQMFYLSAIANYLSFTQHCTFDTASHRLQTIIDGLKLRRTLILPIGASAELANEKQDLWTYTVFVSLILYNLAADVFGYAILLRDPGGNELTQWSPLNTRLEPPSCFKVNGTQKTSQYANPSLITRIIASPGIAWLNQDEQILPAIFELIVSPNPDLPLGALILEANGAEKVSETRKTPHSKPSSTTVVTKPSHKKSGQLFRNWLMMEVSSEGKKTNIHHTINGLALIDPDVFQQYANDQPSHWQEIRTEFLKLNLHKESYKDGTHTISIPKLGKKNVLLIPSIKKT